MVSPVCFLCRSPSSVVCGECGAHSCSPAHGDIHRHAVAGCLPVKIEHRQGVGNCCVATRDISPGETILLDTPAVWGPNLKSAPKCLNCLGAWRGALCPDCQFPVCDEQCALGAHHVQECGVLARVREKYTFTPGENSNPALSLVSVIRFLRLPVTHPEKAARANLLMDHLEDIVKNEDLYNMWKVSAIEPLVHKLPNSPYTEEDVLHAIGVLQTNTVAIGVPGYNQGHALYPTFSYLSHSCVCNARFQILPDHTLVLRAQVPILAGEEITIQYMTPMLGNVTRRRKIRKNWFFDCTCSRCSDPTELGTFASGVVCRDCIKEGRDGVLLPLDSLDYDSEWRCSQDSCSVRIDSSTMQAMISALEAELEGINESNVEVLQDLVLKWLGVLHPQHYLLLLLKRKLLAALKLVSSSNPPRGLLTATIELAEESIRIFDVLDPGLTILKGRMLQYKNGPELMLAKMDLQEGKISKLQFMQATARAMKNVKMATGCFEEYHLQQ